MNKRFLIIAVLCGLSFAAFGAYLADKKSQPAVAKDTAVEQFRKLILKDSEGRPQALSQWQDQFLVVNFWATWCKPCVQEMPELVQLQKELATKNVQILGLGIDTPTNIAEFAKKHQISYPLFAAGLEGTDLSSNLGNKAGGLPFTVLISSDGRVLKAYSGRLKMEELRSDILNLNTKK